MPQGRRRDRRGPQRRSCAAHRRVRETSRSAPTTSSRMPPLSPAATIATTSRLKTWAGGQRRNSAVRRVRYRRGRRAGRAASRVRTALDRDVRPRRSGTPARTSVANERKKATRARPHPAERRQSARERPLGPNAGDEERAPPQAGECAYRGPARRCSREQALRPSCARCNEIHRLATRSISRTSAGRLAYAARGLRAKSFRAPRVAERCLERAHAGVAAGCHGVA